MIFSGSMPIMIILPIYFNTDDTDIAMCEASFSACHGFHFKYTSIIHDTIENGGDTKILFLDKWLIFFVILIVI